MSIMDKTHFLHLYNFQLVLLSQLHKKKTQLVCYPWLVQTSIENSENMFPMQLAITSDSIDNYVKHKMLEATGLKTETIMLHYRVILSFTIYNKGSAKAELTARRKNYEKLPLRSRFGLEMTSPIFHTIERLRFHFSVPLT
jgi:hypothetical protein